MVKMNKEPMTVEKDYKEKELKWRSHERTVRGHLSTWNECQKKIPHFEEMIYWIMAKGMSQHENQPENHSDYGIEAGLNECINRCKEAADGYKRGVDLGYDDEGV